MLNLLKNATIRTIAKAIVCVNLGFGYAAPSFAAVYTANDAGWDQSQSTGTLNAQSLGAMLQSLGLQFNELTQNGQTSYQINVPARGTNAAVTICVGIPPNSRFVNIWYIAGQFNQQNCPSQQALLAMLQENGKTCPAYLDIENDCIVLRDDIENVNVTAAELMARLKDFYAAAQDVRTVCPSTTPAQQPSPNPFG